MAFCSECGKSNVDQATVCDGCGKPIRSAATAGAPVRFKGTMIMGATVPKPVAPAASAPTPTPTPAPIAPAPAPQPNLAFQATMMGPMTAPGASAPPPAAAHVPAVMVAAKPAVSPKGTMIGGMIGAPRAFQPPVAGQPQHASVLTPAAASSDASGMAVAPPPDATPAADTSREPPLPAPSVDSNYGAQGNYGGYGVAPSKNTKTWLWIALGVVGALVFACVATGLAVYFGAGPFRDKLVDVPTDVAK